MVALPNTLGENRDATMKAEPRKELSDGDNSRPNAGAKVWPVFQQRKSVLIPQTPKTRVFLRNFRNERRASSDTDDPESFHCAMGPILVMAQTFGVLPVCGIRASSPARLRFTLLSFRAAYALLVVATILVIAAISVVHMVKTLNADTFSVHSGIAAATAGAIFYGNSLLGTVLFLWLSPRWVALQQDWRSMERYMDSNKPERPKLRRKFLTISGVVLLLALIEHLLSMANNVGDYDWGRSGNGSFSEFLRLYCLSSHAFVIDNLEYNFALGIFIFVVSKVATFTWNFTDIFVMLVAQQSHYLNRAVTWAVSTGLSERYKVLNKYLIGATAKSRAVDWCEIREDYAILSSMVKKVDNDISPIILLSFANNLYFICLQLLNGLSRPAESTALSGVYFFGSFAFLIGRTCAVTLLTAGINDQSRLALPSLYNCPASTYSVETQRLQYQLTTDDIALTGLRFFSITRNFMLAVAGAIVTYEVVLLQFNVAMKK